MVDAPVGRTPAEAELGRLSSLLGGDPAHVAAIRPVVEAYADTIIEAGALGDAVTIKLVNNFVSFGNAMVIGESMAAAARLGVNLEALCAMIEAGGANSVMFQWIVPWIRNGDDSRGRGRLDGAAGVLDTYRAIAAESGAPTRLADTMSALMQDILAGGHGSRFIPALPGVLADMAGAHIRPLD
jgi:3-hydroxyisobutyrate dehydrogenase-like beta-hydroxyacid dehydrogenase